MTIAMVMIDLSVIACVGVKAEFKVKTTDRTSFRRPHRLDKTVDQDKDDGLVDAGGDAGGGADGVDKLEAEGEDGRQEEGGDEDLGRN